MSDLFLFQLFIVNVCSPQEFALSGKILYLYSVFTTIT